MFLNLGEFVFLIYISITEDGEVIYLTSPLNENKLTFSMYYCLKQLFFEVALLSTCVRN